jgi:hypothetical protein
MDEVRKLRVFLCHASQDKPVVRALYQRLLDEGWIDPWLDEENLLPGQDRGIELEKALESTDDVQDGREKIETPGERVIRGAFSSKNERFSVRSARRGRATPDKKEPVLGFRIVVAPQVS